MPIRGNHSIHRIVHGRLLAALIDFSGGMGPGVVIITS
jgi:hypothetical protein